MNYFLGGLFNTSSNTHTQSRLCTILLGVLKIVAKINSITPKSMSDQVDIFYHDHINALLEVILAPPTFPKMGELW